MTLRVIIAEDDRDVAEVVAFGVRMNWPDCRVEIAACGEEAFCLFEEEPADLMILDVSIPPPDGLEVCRRIRAVSLVPILMLTVHDETVHKVRALDLGADDYVTKPFDHTELLARLRALVRRTRQLPSSPDQSFAAGGFALDYATREVHLQGERIRLTSTEYRLLEELVRHAGTTLRREFLLERVWGQRYVGDTHYLKVFVRRLRRKLGDDPKNPRYIQTEWGVGYRFLPLR